MTRDEIIKNKKNLRNADLHYTDLHYTDLRDADLHGADLSGADLHSANLYDADLSDAYLSDADLRGAILQGADLRGSNLRGSNLRGSNLRGSNLRGAILQGAHLYYADLRGAVLDGATLPNEQHQLPEGDLVVYKSVGKVIVKLLIPQGAKRTGSLVGPKCRAEYAKVLEIEDEEHRVTSTPSLGIPTTYTVGEMVAPDSYDDDIRVECTHGIHFYRTREEAKQSGF